MANVPMTVHGRELIEKELDHLIRVEREQIKEALAFARELGDLKENAEYHAAKEKQSHVEGRIAELQSKVAHAQVIDVKKIHSEHIVFGATVDLFDHQKDISITIQIVGEDEAGHEPHKISVASPLGKSLIGKQEGDEIVVKAPRGDMMYLVESFKYV
jgi:transcription elongation factor GreA